MKIIEVKSVKKLLLGSKLIGHGTTCLCFLMSNNKLLKLYLNTYNKRKLFSIFDMYEHLEYLNTLNNDTYIGPDAIYVKDGEIIGYEMEYKKAKTIDNISLNTKIDDILGSIKKLEEDTRIISDNNFGVYDVHGKNILFNDNLYVIDLDYGREESLTKLYEYNMQRIIKAIYESLFKIKPDQMLEFYDPKLNGLYIDSYYNDYNNIYDFYELLKNQLDKDDLRVKDVVLSRNRLSYKKYNSYYKPY